MRKAQKAPRSFDSVVSSCYGKMIRTLIIDEQTLRVGFSTGEVLELQDCASYCCESRHMSTDDEVSEFCGGIFTKLEVSVVGNGDAHGGNHDIQFLRLHTDLGIVVFQNHNEHNGYYGGFELVAVLGELRAVQSSD